jgi:hypothetical protein
MTEAHPDLSAPVVRVLQSSPTSFAGWAGTLEVVARGPHRPHAA